MKVFIAVVDDEKIIRNGITKIIQRNVQDAQVCGTFGSARECMAYTDSHPVDLIVTDIRMPDLTGLDMMKIIRQNHPYLDFVVISGYSDFEYCRTAIQYKVFDYLLKPIEKEELIWIVRQYCAMKNDDSMHSLQQINATQEVSSIQAIKKYIRYHYSERITMEELGNKLFLNPNYISQLFKKETGQSVSSYILKIRMEMACSYLEDYSRNISEVAQMTGYSSPKPFAVAFRKYMGMSPSEYRSGRGIDLREENYNNDGADL